MSKLWIIAKEVYRKNVKSWGFFFMVFAPFIIMGVSVLIGYFIANDESSHANETIAIVSQDQGLKDSLSQDNLTYKLAYYEDEASARQALNQKGVNGYLKVQEDNGRVQATYYQKSTAHSLTLSDLAESLNRYQLSKIGQSLNLNDQQIATIRSSKVSIGKINLKESKDGTYSEEDAKSLQVMARMGAAFVAIMLSYMLILAYSSIFAQEVALEKGNRVMEIILSSIPAKQHLLGKILGASLVMATQIGIYLILGIGFYFLTGVSTIFSYLEPFKPLLLGILPIFGLSLVFALMGMLAYMILSVLLGSIATRLEDVQKSIQPVIFTTIIGFYIAIYGLQQPNSPVVVIGSWVPFTSPFVMPVRLATETVSNLEIVLCLLGCFAFMVFAFWLALTFYKATVLSTSDKGVIHAFKRSYSLWKSEKGQKA